MLGALRRLSTIIRLTGGITGLASKSSLCGEHIAAQEKEVAKQTAIVEANLGTDGELESIVAADVLEKDTWEPIVKVCRWFCKDSGRFSRSVRKGADFLEEESDVESWLWAACRSIRFLTLGSSRAAVKESSHDSSLCVQVTPFGRPSRLWEVRSLVFFCLLPTVFWRLFLFVSQMTREDELRNLAQRITTLADGEEDIAFSFSALVVSTASSRTASP